MQCMWLCSLLMLAVRNLKKNARTLKYNFVLFCPLGGFSQEELLKIWKGLFYCMWVQDEPLLQVTSPPFVTLLDLWSGGRDKRLVASVP